MNTQHCFTDVCHQQPKYNTRRYSMIQLIPVFPWGYSLPHMRSFVKSRAGSPLGASICIWQCLYPFSRKAWHNVGIVFWMGCELSVRRRANAPRRLVILIKLRTYLRQSIYLTSHGWAEKPEWIILLGWELNKPCDLVQFTPQGLRKRSI